MTAADSSRMASPAPVIPPGGSAKKSKIRWHFGIRSRSEPLEVMLEIYRTLKTLGFEWKEKDPEKKIHMDEYDNDFGEVNEENGKESGLSGTGEDMKKRKRKEDEDFLKKAQALFFIETRCRLEDVMVRMDLQLYSIDSENYLVDFRNLGYRLLRPSPKLGQTNSFEDLSQDYEHDSVSRMHTLGNSSSASTTGVLTPLAGETPPQPLRSRQPSQDATARQLLEAAAKARVQGASDGKTGPAVISRRSSSGTAKDKRNVSTPFLFLECACKLIVELGEQPTSWSDAPSTDIWGPIKLSVPAEMEVQSSRCPMGVLLNAFSA